MRKSYACVQEPEESVASYAAGVEEVFSQAIELKMIAPTHDEILRNVLYQGLQPQLKQLANFKYETIKDYDKFKIN